MTRAQHTQQEGFALIVVTALFVAFALMATAVIDRTNATKQLDAQETTRARLNRLSMAVIEYSVFNQGRYPCPAATNVDISNAMFGRGISNCSVSAGGLTVLTDGIGSTAVRGLVPVMDLAPYGITPNDAFDAWNNRIMFAVDRAMTVNPPVASVTGRMIVVENNTGQQFRRPDFIVYSYGRDGLGATPKTRTAIAVPCPNVGQARDVNCDGDVAFIRSPVQTAPSAGVDNYFDDLLFFYGR